MTDRKIVVGVDGSEHGLCAVRWAAQQAQDRGAQLVLVHAWQHSPNYVVPTRIVVDDATEALGGAVAAASAFGVEPEPRLVEGPPVTMLVEEGHDAEMLVVGSHGQGRVADAVLGSVSSGCIHHATSPVVVIPAGMAPSATLPDKDRAALGS